MNPDSGLQTQVGSSSLSGVSNGIRRHSASVPGVLSGSWFSRAWALARETVESWSEDNAARLAASLAYYTLLSLAPLVVLTIALAGLEFGADAAKGQIAHEVASVTGPEAGVAIQSIVANAKAPTSGLVGPIVGVVVLLFGASGAFGELQSALNTIWRVKTKPGRGVMGIIRDRGFSLAMVLCVAFLLLVSLILSAALAAIGKFFAAALPGGESLWQLANFSLSLAIATLLFALMFKVIPDARIEWRDVWIGAVVTAILFTLGKTLLAIYIGKFGAVSAFGAAGSLVALVIWVYYSSQVLFLGAEFTRVYASHYGKQIGPNKNAIPIGGSDSQPRSLGNSNRDLGNE